MTHDRLSVAALDTPIGRLWVAVSPRGVVAVSRGSTPSLGTPDSVDSGAAGAAVAELAAYFAGRVRAFDVRLDLTDAGAFDAAVWTAVRSIPFGTTASYGEVAIMASRPGAARAVGGSMARCPFFPLVPCHRVIAADGSLGGWGGDPSVKRWLLAFESGERDPGRHPRAPAIRQVHTGW